MIERNRGRLSIQGELSSVGLSYSRSNPLGRERTGYDRIGMRNEKHLPEVSMTRRRIGSWAWNRLLNDRVAASDHIPLSRLENLLSTSIHISRLTVFDLTTTDNQLYQRQDIDLDAMGNCVLFGSGLYAFFPWWPFLFSLVRKLRTDHVVAS
jgi:hypothetical protein